VPSGRDHETYRTGATPKWHTIEACLPEGWRAFDFHFRDVGISLSHRNRRREKQEQEVRVRARIPLAVAPVLQASYVSGDEIYVPMDFSTLLGGKRLVKDAPHLPYPPSGPHTPFCPITVPALSLLLVSFCVSVPHVLAGLGLRGPNAARAQASD